MARMKAVDNKKTLSKVIQVEKNYSFSPYSYTSCGVTLALFYVEWSGEVSTVPRADVPPIIFFLLEIDALAFQPLKLEGNESVESSSLQRILRQFNFDQGVVWIMGDACFSSI